MEKIEFMPVEQTREGDVILYQWKHEHKVTAVEIDADTVRVEYTWDHGDDDTGTNTSEYPVGDKYSYPVIRKGSE